MNRITLSDPVSLPEQYRETVLGFLREYWNDRQWEMRNHFGIEFDLSEFPHNDDDLLRLLVADLLSQIARAAAGETEHLDQGEVYECCQSLCEKLFAAPGIGASYTIPQEFWDAPIGQMVALAFIWLEGDELITMTQAAEISGKSVSNLSQMIDRGKLRSYPDPNEPNPTRRNRLKRSDIVSLKN